MTGTTTARLCAFAADTDWPGLPAGARAAASRTAGNTLALAVGASGSPAVERVLRALAPLSPGGDAPVLGRAERLTPVWAACAHGVAAHVDDYDDTHPATLAHAGAPIVPAALAGARIAGGTGADVLTAVAVGAEVALRLGQALTPSVMDRGWHVTGVVGTVGAAVAAGRAMGLDRRQLGHAVGVAAAQSAGLLEALGTMVKSLHAGKAAAAGVEAAQLAAAGVAGPAAPLEGRRGLLALLRPATAGAGGAEPAADDALLAELGSRWEIEATEVKPYACGVVGHPVLDLARSLRRELPAGELPAEVRLDVHPLVPTVLGRRDPATGLEAKFSAAHCFAVGLLREDGGGPASFTDAAATAPDVARLRQRCTLAPDPSLGRYAVRATVVRADGRVVERAVVGARRMGPEDVRAKARAVTAPVLAERHDAFVDTVFALDRVTDLELVTAAGRPSAPR